jgi:histidinol-phosphate/aromatic aminotransferase/cobyric acid decarboxylase-like protein
VKEVKMKNFICDVDGILKAVTKKTKIIFIGNPNNPTGTYINKKDFLRLMENLRRDVLVVLDTVFFFLLEACASTFKAGISNAATAIIAKALFIIISFYRLKIPCRPAFGYTRRAYTRTTGWVL